ncbi:ATP-binding protein [Pedobacter puniceum]|uniref:AAA family ATPase n=1 Tax=Pedobacter puniceum TaxID=2666136 RepID=A0A7K0FT58_9SPHI|nr:AAA family ATPase [Pedobacter puniceum]MRX48665.1 AAA family ATPase [Pedobacter puniceum]
MEFLFEKYQQKLRYTNLSYIRSMMDDIDWDARLIGIKGARGIGKTTLLLQYIKLYLSDKLSQTLYVSLDDIWFNNHLLSDLVADFVRKGGAYLFLDEVHKYKGWAQELKNIYDDYPLLKVVFTGSSLLEILNARADLSRRAVVYQMQGFSFREYIALETSIKFEKLTLASILENHVQEASIINNQIKPFQYFDDYLRQGYYPFYQEQPNLYASRLGEVINMILEIELPLLRGMDIAYISKIKQLLMIIAESVPFIPNVSKLSERIGINRATLLSYFHYLDEINLTKNLFKDAKGISLLQKPSKVYLENTNLSFAISPQHVNKGSLRETFFINQVAYLHELNYTDRGDFKVNNHYTFEIGGKDKDFKQLEGLEDAFVVCDDIEYGFGRKIPLWLFGFLY